MHDSIPNHLIIVMNDIILFDNESTHKDFYFVNYPQKHGMHEVDRLDDVLLSPVSSKISPTSLVAPVANSNWLPDPYTGYSGTHTTYSNKHSRVTRKYTKSCILSTMLYS